MQGLEGKKARNKCSYYNIISIKEMCISQNDKGGKSLEFTDLNIICEVTQSSHIRKHQDKYTKFPNS